MNWAVTVYAAILFFVLTPGVLVSLPPKATKLVVAGTHAVVFALIFGFTCPMVWRATLGLGMPAMKREGMEDKKKQYILEPKA